MSLFQRRPWFEILALPGQCLKLAVGYYFFQIVFFYELNSMTYRKSIERCILRAVV